jgi:hypothetical protein
MENKEIRTIQLVAREGVLGELLEKDDFPTEGHKKVIQLLYDETLAEMYSLGLTECD